MRVVAIFTEALCNQCLTRRSEPPSCRYDYQSRVFDLEQIQVEQKAPNDYVTEVDKAAEEAIIDVLISAYPTHAVLAEESGGSNNLNDESENVWIIDPLDGTTNFIHQFPAYCISIALQQKGVITQAVIYDPVHNDLFTATKGGGAFLNNKRIRVSKTIASQKHCSAPVLPTVTKMKRR